MLQSQWTVRSARYRVGTPHFNGQCKTEPYSWERDTYRMTKSHKQLRRALAKGARILEATASK